MNGNVFLIECKNENLSKLRSYTQNALKKAKIDNKTAFEITMAIDELCANIIEHSIELHQHDAIKIEITRNDKCVIVKITDEGKPFNPTQYASKNILDLIKNKSNGGLGLAIVNKFMDKIEYKVQNTFNVCTLYKNISITR